jgi:Glyoxalase-like domain
MSSTPSWVTTFLDFTPGGLERGIEFWRGVTGYDVSARRGTDDEFATLVPPDGDSYLKVQGLTEGPGRVHLDLHVATPAHAAEAALELGGHVLVRHEEGYVVVRSPGGLVFCFVAHAGAHRPAPATWPSGRSQVDQVCLDIPPSAYDVEVEFWRALTGWELDPDVDREFARLDVPDDQPLRWLIQRLDDEADEVSAHLDLSADDRDAEVARHVALGATQGPRHDWWTVLTDPVGTTYCVTRRKPR